MGEEARSLAPPPAAGSPPGPVEGGSSSKSASWGLPLRVVSGQPLRTPIKHVLKLNAAFGGQNTALVVKRYEP